MVLQDCLVAGKLLPDEISFVGIRMQWKTSKIFLQEGFYQLLEGIIIKHKKTKSTQTEPKKLRQKYA